LSWRGSCRAERLWELFFEEAAMAAADGVKQYWLVLTNNPRLLIFNYLDAQQVWQKHFYGSGSVKFFGKNSYISFMQALMMDGVKGTALIAYLGDIYKAGTTPGASGISVLQKGMKKAAMGVVEYEKQIKDLKNAPLSSTWRNAALYSCRFIFDAIKEGQEISPSDLG
jgi:hypothetical protein